MLRLTLCTTVVAAVALTTGCAELGDVKPWQKANLARPSMTMGANPLEERYEEHIALSKEGSSGGSSVGGGGCGCN